MTRSAYDRLSAHDAGYLTRETAAQPLHYVLQLEVAGRLSLADVRSAVRARLGVLPELHRRLRYPLLKGRPVWVDDPDFDVTRQVVAWATPVTTADEADRVLELLAMDRLPRDRPLWRLTVAPGSADRTVLWLSVHHALMDGGLLSRTLSELFPAAPVEAPTPWTPVRGPSRAALLASVVGRRLRRSQATPPAPVEPAAAPAAVPAAPLEPRLLHGPVSDTRTVAAVTLPLADLRSVRERTGATINDLFLAAVTDALRDYLPGWTSAPLPTDLLALVPRDVRTEAEARALGNRGWSMLVRLPIGIADRDERLAEIQRVTAAGKTSERTMGTAGWRFDIALTNVRLGGPHAVAGQPVVAHRVAVPLQGENRIVAVATSQADDFTISYTADAAMFSDIDKLAALTLAAFSALA